LAQEVDLRTLHWLIREEIVFLELDAFSKSWIVGFDGFDALLYDLGRVLDDEV
jgi:hypothetical protein